MIFSQYPTDNKTIYYFTGNQSDVPADELWLTPKEASVLGGLKIRKRRQDWLLGRWTAKSALSRLAQPQRLPAGNWQITAGEDGAPSVLLNGRPAGLCISISHSSGLSFCAVAGDSQRMGCDIEKIEERSRSFEETFFTAGELELLEGCEAGERARLVTLVWSAKESVLKAIRTGLRADTRRIRIVSIETGGTGRWLQFKAEDGHNRERFSGWWQRSAAMIFTVATDNPDGEPVGL